MMKSFQQSQIAFTQYLRSPSDQPVPEAMEERRMVIYRDLIYNNIEGLIAGVFPVLRSVLGDQYWHSTVREFIKNYRCQTPYFIEISEEFLQFLMQPAQAMNELPFVTELAHYEWVELALDISEAELPAPRQLPENIDSVVFAVSPVAVVLSYQYPVHKISTHFKPVQPEPIQLVVYRNRADKVRFMTVNPLTSRLLYLMQAHPELCLRELLRLIAEEMHHPQPEQLISAARELVTELYAQDILHLAQ